MGIFVGRSRQAWLVSGFRLKKTTTEPVVAKRKSKKGRSLNDQVTARALQMMEDAREWLEDSGETLSLHRIAVMWCEITGQPRQTVQSHLKRLLAGSASWRVDDMQAFAAVFQRPIEALLSDEAEEKVSDLTVATQMMTQLNDRLTPDQARELIGMLRYSTRNPDIYEFMWELCAAAVSGGSRGDILLRLAQVVQEADYLDDAESATGQAAWDQRVVGRRRAANRRRK